MAPDFVGRVAELDELVALARGEVGSLVAAAFVHGDPGSGKSRLLAELSLRLGRVSCLRIAGYEAERAVPLAAVSDVLRSLVATGEEGARPDVAQIGRRSRTQCCAPATSPAHPLASTTGSGLR